MTFQFREKESVARGIRRIARAQIRKAQGDLARTGGGKPDAAVHAARKRLKRLRALVRLARAALGNRVARRENARFRDAGRPLSAARDAEILTQTLDALIARYGAPAPPEALDAFRDALSARRREQVQHAFHQGDVLARITSELNDALRDAKRWKARARGWSALAPGLKRLYRQGRNALRAARDSPTGDALHEWRKRVKDLWSALELLRPIRPAFTERLIADGHRLADLLGDDHDLAVLAEALASPDLRGPVEAIGPLIVRRRAELEAEAFALGVTLYRVRPGEFTKRLEAYWHAWRSDTEDFGESDAQTSPSQHS